MQNLPEPENNILAHAIEVLKTDYNAQKNTYLWVGAPIISSPVITQLQPQNRS